MDVQLTNIISAVAAFFHSGDNATVFVRVKGAITRGESRALWPESDAKDFDTRLLVGS